MQQSGTSRTIISEDPVTGEPRAEIKFPPNAFNVDEFKVDFFETEGGLMLGSGQCIFKKNDTDGSMVYEFAPAEKMGSFNLMKMLMRQRHITTYDAIK